MATIAVFSCLEVFLSDLREKWMFLHWECTRQLQERCFVQNLLSNRFGGVCFHGNMVVTFTSFEAIYCFKPCRELEVPMRKLRQFEFTVQQEMLVRSHVLFTKIVLSPAGSFAGTARAGPREGRCSRWEALWACTSLWSGFFHVLLLQSCGYDYNTLHTVVPLYRNQSLGTLLTACWWTLCQHESCTRADLSGVKELMCQMHIKQIVHKANAVVDKRCCDTESSAAVLTCVYFCCWITHGIFYMDCDIPQTKNF